jgi:hypothetical protein
MCQLALAALISGVKSLDHRGTEAQRKPTAAFFSLCLWVSSTNTVRSSTGFWADFELGEDYILKEASGW